MTVKESRPRGRLLALAGTVLLALVAAPVAHAASTVT